MTVQGYKQPTFLGIMAGILLFVLLVALACSLSTTVKTLGYALLYVPSRLGWVQSVRPDDIRRLDLVHTPVVANFPESGTFLVYTSNLELLTISLQLEESNNRAWLKVTQVGTGQPADVQLVKRGLLPFDTPFAEGRPVMRLVIPQAGLYQLNFPTPPAARIYFVPDTITGKEWLIWLVYALEIAIVVGAPAWFYLRRWRREAEDLAAWRRTKRQQADEFWTKERDLK
jgi:hypothetical protein